MLAGAEPVIGDPLVPPRCLTQALDCSMAPSGVEEPGPAHGGGERSSHGRAARRAGDVESPGTNLRRESIHPLVRERRHPNPRVRTDWVHPA